MTPGNGPSPVVGRATMASAVPSAAGISMNIGSAYPTGLGVIPAQGLRLELEEAAVLDGEPGVVDHFHHEALVVDRDQRGGEHLLGLEQVVDVSPGVVLAGVAVAALLERPEVALVLGAGEVEAAVRVVERGIAGHP